MAPAARKRKRSSSRGSEQSLGSSVDVEVSSPNGLRNPFLELLDNDDENVESSGSRAEQRSRNENQILSLVVQFMDLSQNKKPVTATGTPAVANDSFPEGKVSEVATRLMEIIMKHNEKDSISSRGPISTVDIAGLVLPWAIRCVLRCRASEQEELTWEILWQCTVFLLDSRMGKDNSTHVEQDLMNHFSLSNLHKLVPLAASIALPVTGDACEEVLGVPVLAAKCYCKWVESLYRPTLDTVCDVLIPMIAKRAKKVIEVQPDNPESKTNENGIYNNMALATMTLLESSLRKANSKKGFHALIQPSTLSALSDIYVASNHHRGSSTIQTLIRKVIDVGLFDPEGHLDGFRSMQMKIPDLSAECNDDSMEIGQDGNLMENDNSTKKKTFHCYQEGLLSILLKSIRDSTGEHASYAISLARIAPVLLERFITQTNGLRDSKAKDVKVKKKGTAKKLSQFQFLFFANLTIPMIRLLTLDVVVDNDNLLMVCLESLHDCILQLLKYDVYLPSNDDEGDRNFIFLQSLAQSLLNQRNRILPLKVLPVLAVILQLNHLTLHDKLNEIIASCIQLIEAQTSSKETNIFAPETMELFCGFVCTYKKLRQLDYLFTVFETAVSALRDDGNIEVLRVFSQLWTADDLCEEVRKAVQHSPIIQVKEIVSHYNDWISKNIVNCKPTESNEASDIAVSIVVDVFCLLIRNVWVDSTSAHELCPLCFDICSLSVQSLVKDNPTIEYFDNLTRKGILLFGWTLDLNNRCDFWLRNSREDASSKELNFPLGVSSLLTAAMELTVSTKSTKEIPTFVASELQLVACHRLEQLHGRIHGKQRVAFATSSEEYRLEEDLKEIQQLSYFALHALKHASNTMVEFKQQWNILAGVISSWAPYVGNDDIRWFLAHLFSAIEADGERSDNGIWLLRDASFLETPNIVGNFGSSGLLHAMDTFCRALASDNGHGHLSNILQFPSLQPSQSKEPELAGVTRKRLAKPPNSRMPDILPSSLAKILVTLKILNQIQGPLWETCGSVNLWFESCVRMEHVCQHLGLWYDEVRSISLALVVEFRKVLSCILDHGSGCDEVLDGSDLLRWCFRDTADLVNDLSASLEVAMELADSTAMLVAKIVCRKKATGDVQDLLQPMQSIYEERKVKDAESISLVLMSLGRSLISNLSIGDNSGSSEIASRIIRTVTERHWDAAKAIVFEAAKDGRQQEKHTASLFMGEVLRSELGADLIESIEGAMIKLASNFIGRHQTVDMQRESHLLAAFVSAGPSLQTRRKLLDTILNICHDPPAMVQHLLCELALGMEKGELETFFATLLSKESLTSGDLVSRLRLLRLVLLNAEGVDQIEVISKSSRCLFSMALCAMVSLAGDGLPVSDAIELLQDLVSRRDFLSVRERDLCLILAYVETTLRRSENDTRSIQQDVFDSCFSMVSFLLQRFSKQLQNCIASVTRALSALLRHCLYDTLTESDTLERGKKFGRLSELLLPHGDVYKKHILCLIVEFVRAMKRDINPLIRISLSSAMFCLLDILQEHETTQLNSMLDDMGRALLRNVHESYKKQHVYKGQ